MATLSELAARYAGTAVDGSLDLLPFAIRAFELARTADIEYLIAHGCDGSEFFHRELKPNWRGLTREQRASKIASFVRFANLLDHRGEDPPATPGKTTSWPSAWPSCALRSAPRSSCSPSGDRRSQSAAFGR